jgi:hypothetical protein
VTRHARSRIDRWQAGTRPSGANEKPQPLVTGTLRPEDDGLLVPPIQRVSTTPSQLRLNKAGAQGPGGGAGGRGGRGGGGGLGCLAALAADWVIATPMVRSG